MADNNLSTSVTVSFIDRASGKIEKVAQSFRACGGAAQAASLAFVSTMQSCRMFNGVCEQLVKHIRGLSLALRTGEVSASSFRRTINLYGVSVSKLPGHFDRLTAAQRKNIGSFRKMMSNQKFIIKDEASRKLATIYKRLEAVNRIAQTCIQTFTNLNAAINLTTSSINGNFSNISDTSSQIRNSLDQATQGATTLKHSLSGVQDRLKSVSATVKDIGQGMQKAGHALKSLGVSMLGAAGAVSGGAIKIVKDYADVQYSEAELRNVLTGKSESDKDLKARSFNTLAMQLATTLPGSIKDMNKMFLALRERGISEEDILNGAGLATAQFATVMRLGFDDAARKLADIKGALGIENAKDLPALVELLSKTKSASGLTLDNMLATLRYASAGFKSQDITGLEAARNVLALMALSKKGGATGSMAGTSTSNVLDLVNDIEKALNKDSFQKRFGKLLASHGINFNFHDADGNFLGFKNMLGQFEKLNVFNRHLRAQILGEMSNARARRLIQGWLVSGGISGYEKAKSNIDNQAGLDYRIKNIMNTITQQWGLIWANVENVVGSIGAAIERNFNIKDKMGSIANFIGKIAAWINKNPKAVDDMLKKAAEILKVVTLLGSAFIVIGSVLSAIGTILTLAAGLPAVVTALASAKAVLGVIIGGLSYIGLLVYEMWPVIKNFFKGIWQSIKDSELFKRAKHLLVNSFKDLWGEVDHAFKHISKIDWFEVGTLFGAVITRIGSYILAFMALLSKFATVFVKCYNILAYVVVRMVNLVLAWEKAVKGGQEARKHLCDELMRIPEDIDRVAKDIGEVGKYLELNGTIVPRDFVGPLAPGMVSQRDIDARNFNKNFKEFNVNGVQPIIEGFQRQLSTPDSEPTKSNQTGKSGAEQGTVDDAKEIKTPYFAGTINYSPIVNVGNGSPENYTAFSEALYRHAQDIAAIMRGSEDEYSRLAIGGAFA